MKNIWNESIKDENMGIHITNELRSSSRKPKLRLSKPWYSGIHSEVQVQVPALIIVIIAHSKTQDCGTTTTILPITANLHLPAPAFNFKFKNLNYSKNSHKLWRRPLPLLMLQHRHSARLGRRALDRVVERQDSLA